jgi:hypothetical protein
VAHVDPHYLKRGRASMMFLLVPKVSGALWERTGWRKSLSLVVPQRDRSPNHVPFDGNGVSAAGEVPKALR